MIKNKIVFIITFSLIGCLPNPSQLVDDSEKDLGFKEEAFTGDIDILPLGNGPSGSDFGSQVKAYEEHVVPLLLDNQCSVCHGTNGFAPRYLEEDDSGYGPGYELAISRGLIDFENLENSLLANKLGQSNHPTHFCQNEDCSELNDKILLSLTEFISSLAVKTEKVKEPEDEVKKNEEENEESKNDSYPFSVSLVEAQISYEKNVYQVLKNQCASCHAYGNNNHSDVSLDVAFNLALEKEYVNYNQADASRFVSAINDNSIFTKHGCLGNIDCETIKSDILFAIDEYLSEVR